MSGYTLIKDALGNPAFVVQVDAPHVITNLSQRVLYTLMITLIVVAIGIDFIVLAYLERSILSRLTRLSHSVQQITQNRDTQARVEEGTPDELGILARTINDMLRTIAQDAQLKEENTSRFKMLVEGNRPSACTL